MMALTPKRLFLSFSLSLHVYLSSPPFFLALTIGSINIFWFWIMTDFVGSVSLFTTKFPLHIHGPHTAISTTLSWSKAGWHNLFTPSFSASQRSIWHRLSFIRVVVAYQKKWSIHIVVLEIKSFKVSESFKSVDQGVLGSVYTWGGGGDYAPPPPPGWDRVNPYLTETPLPSPKPVWQKETKAKQQARILRKKLYSENALCVIPMESSSKVITVKKKNQQIISYKLLATVFITDCHRTLRSDTEKFTPLGRVTETG